jgi:hypothetical protein
MRRSYTQSAGYGRMKRINKSLLDFKEESGEVTHSLLDKKEWVEVTQSLLDKEE